MTGQIATTGPVPGDFFLSRIGGTLGAAIEVGQVAFGDTSRRTHAGIVLPADTPGGGLRVLAAQPRGARIEPLATVLGRPDTVFSHFPLTSDQRNAVIAGALDLVGTPYAFTDYAALAFLRFGITTPWVVNRVADPSRLICSQLVDLVYMRAGIHLFADGRRVQNVTPGSLANLLALAATAHELPRAVTGTGDEEAPNGRA